MIYTNPRTYTDEELLHILETQPDPAHIGYGTPEYTAWLRGCQCEAERRR